MGHTTLVPSWQKTINRTQQRAWHLNRVNDTMNSRQRAPRWAAAFLALSLAAAACTDRSTQTEDGADGASGTSVTMVSPDLGSQTMVVNVALTDTGFEPATIFLPAGRHVQLVLRNRGTKEHHYRVAGLIPAQLRWYLYPDVDIAEVDAMSPAEREAIGISGAVDDMEHVVHHLAPTFVPFKEPSRSGIRPIPNEVHGYVQAGTAGDVLTFFPLNTGSFVVEDVLHPEIAGKVVVFEVEA